MGFTFTICHFSKVNTYCLISESQSSYSCVLLQATAGLSVFTSAGLVVTDHYLSPQSFTLQIPISQCCSIFWFTTVGHAIAPVIWPLTVEVRVNPRSLCVGFVVGFGTGMVFPPSTSVYLVSIIPPVLHTSH